MSKPTPTEAQVTDYLHKAFPQLRDNELYKIRMLARWMAVGRKHPKIPIVKPVETPIQGLTPTQLTVDELP